MRLKDNKHFLASRLPSGCNFGLLAKSALMLLLASSVIGCHQASDSESVNGHVSYQSKPLANAAVTFFPTNGRPITATVTPDGDYEIDLPVGEYSVVINVASELPAGFKEGDLIPPPKVVLPDHYSQRAKTKLTASVAPGHDQPINFDLK